MKKRIKNLAVLASGNGTTLEAVIDAIEDGTLKQKIKIVISNNSDSYALTRAANHNIKTYILKGKNNEERDEELYNVLSKEKVDLVLLLGYLKLIGPKTTNNFTLVNTHPSLIPKYSGKGMYGMNVHEAVYEGKEKETGVTIHFVNEKYDEGNIIWQTHVPVFEKDDAQAISERVQMMEKAQLIWVLKAFQEGKISK